ncbi:MAG TPA: acyltransferase [Candidatus Acidoferrales bacterium]|jgi:acetyltransferase-like isoleucine patch superfamily enzyme|nr:acyltransferase [Candidatus Acidoferrales bacterium]
MEPTVQADRGSAERTVPADGHGLTAGEIKTPRRFLNQGIAAQLMSPLSLVRRFLIRMYSLWVCKTYPFASVGSDVTIHFRSELYRSQAHRIALGNSVFLDKDANLRAHAPSEEDVDPILTIGDGSVIGPRCFLSAKNCIQVDSEVVLEPSVLIQDHSHAYKDVNVTIRRQGVTEGGRIKISQGCWIGQGTVIHCDQGELTLGPNCVVAPNSLVNRSFPGYSLVAGNPARVVKQYDMEKGVWVLGSSRPAAESESSQRRPELQSIR